MEAEAIPLDIISILPPNIIQTILTLLPIRDAFKTSVLSRNWRYHCLNIPKLEFNDGVLKNSNPDNLSFKCRILHVIHAVLLLHLGPILEFSLCFYHLQSCCEIDQIILHLTRHTTLEKFTLCLASGDNHKLLSSFFSLQHLTHLKLKKCAFEPPSTVYGFSKLISLHFDNVEISTKVLLQFISKCPLLKSFTLLEYDNYLTRSGYCDFAELFECLPSIEHLHMNCFPVKCFATGITPQKLPKALVHLKVLHLSGLSFTKKDELHSTLLFVTNSPNIEKIKLEMYNPHQAVSQTGKTIVDPEDYSYVILDQLRELEIRDMRFVMAEMEFVKLILAKASMLEKVRIVINLHDTVNDEVKMLRNLLQYPRASSKAEIIVTRP